MDLDVFLWSHTWHFNALRMSKFQRIYCWSKTELGYLANGTSLRGKFLKFIFTKRYNNFNSIVKKLDRSVWSADKT